MVPRQPMLNHNPQQHGALVNSLLFLLGSNQLYEEGGVSH